MRTNKGQEEMVGLVVIMLVVAVILLIFLGIYLRQNNIASRETDTGVSQFLDSFTDFTTNCTISGVNRDISNLMVRCGDQGTLVKCDNGISVCDSTGFLGKEIKKMIELSWNFGSASTIKSYKFKAEYAPSSGSKKEIFPGLLGPSGGCGVGSKTRGAQRDIPVTGGQIEISLDICQ